MKCFVTGNGAVGGPPGDADVDDGCTTLRSPVFDLSGAQWALVRYWRWWGEGSDSTDDEFVVDVSSNGGATWVPLERIPDAMTAWGAVAIDLTTKITLTNQVVFRFKACDLGSPGLVEAAVDDFSSRSSRRTSPAPRRPRRPGRLRPGAWPAEPVRRQHHPLLLDGAGRPGAAGGLRRLRADGAPVGQRADRGRRAHDGLGRAGRPRGHRSRPGSTSTGSTPVVSTAWRSCCV